MSHPRFLSIYETRALSHATQNTRQLRNHTHPQPCQETESLKRFVREYIGSIVLIPFSKILRIKDVICTPLLVIYRIQAPSDTTSPVTKTHKLCRLNERNLENNYATELLTIDPTFVATAVVASGPSVGPRFCLLDL